MAHIITNTFTKYHQTEQEQLAAMSLCTEQKQFIQNQISVIAEQRLALNPDPKDYTAFIQQESYLKGQLDFAKYMLDCSTEAEKQILEAAEDSPD